MPSSASSAIPSPSPSPSPTPSSVSRFRSRSRSPNPPLSTSSRRAAPDPTTTTNSVVPAEPPSTRHGHKQDAPRDNGDRLLEPLSTAPSSHATSSDCPNPQVAPASTISASASASAFAFASASSSSPSSDKPATVGELAPGASVIEMEPMTGTGAASHRRRRSSLMQSVGSFTPASERPRGQSARAPAVRGVPAAGLSEEPKIIEESPQPSPPVDSGAFPRLEDSGSSGHDGFSDEDLHDDEETGLTSTDRKRKRRKRRRNTLLDQRIARGEEITVEERKEADGDVVRKLIINASLILLWYFFSLSISLYNKWMFDKKQLNFAFPLFTTACHMLVQFGLAALVLFFIPSLRPGAQQDPDQPERPLMSKVFYLTRIGPCGMATGLDIGLGNTSLKFITLTFYTMCKSSSLAFVLIFAFLFRLEALSWRLVAIIATMTFGVILMVSGEVEFKIGGFVLVIAAAMFSGLRWSLTQILLLRNPATSNPFSSIFYLAPVMFLVLTVIAVPVEGFPALFEGLGVLVEEWGPVMTPLFLLFPGCLAFFMTASEFALLQRTSVVTLSIAGIFKEVVTISAAALVFEDRLSPINAIGLIVTMIAIIAYNFIKINKMRSDAQQDVQRDHLDNENAFDGSSHGGSDVEDNTGEEAGLLAAARGRPSSDGNLFTADGDVLPNMAHEQPQEAGTSQAYRAT